MWAPWGKVGTVNNVMCGAEMPFHLTKAEN